SNLVAIVSGHDDVLRYWRKCGNGAQAQVTYMDPGPGCELEILRHSAIKDKPPFRCRLVDESNGVANQIESVLIEVFGGEIRPLPVTWRNIRTSDTNFQLSAIGNELQLATGNRQSDHPGDG